MRILQKVQQAQQEGRVCWSFEYFPPKTEQGVDNLFDRMERMYELGPEFVDVTWGAGGSTSQTTLEICTNAAKLIGLETCMHLTCTNMNIEKIDEALRVCKDHGIQNILALRGDPPIGQERWTAVEGGFAHAADLVRYIRKQYGDYFGIGVAGYPEGHQDCTSLEEDIQHLKEKIDAGGDYVITQLFYDVPTFLRWVEKCRDIGITVPIIPGIMPIHTYNGWKRMTTLSKTLIPPTMAEDLDKIKDDDQAVRDYGIKFCVQMIRDMIAAGIKEFHFYTLNLEQAVRTILQELSFVPAPEKIKPLPWKPSAGKRENENVRPIYWANRRKSYVSRTQMWDEFPNGRWGDSRSPAYGEIDGYGVSLKRKAEDVIAKWGEPTSVQHIGEMFVNFVNGSIDCLPWSDEPLALESDIIKTTLSALNRAGFLTINSQPAVNGVPSTDKRFGWGPNHGYVYQKAYLEFFVSPDNFNILKEKIVKRPSLTYYSVDVKGHMTTNNKRECPTAVTWGVFPNSEIVQPTIVDAQAFNVWKDEAFELWRQWSRVYDPASQTAKLLDNIRENWLLVNIIDNDFICGNIFDVFSLTPVEN